jgi:hypothetical protein
VWWPARHDIVDNRDGRSAERTFPGGFSPALAQRGPQAVAECDCRRAAPGGLSLSGSGVCNRRPATVAAYSRRRRVVCGNPWRSSVSRYSADNGVFLLRFPYVTSVDERAQHTLVLLPQPAKGQAQQALGLGRHFRVAGAATLTNVGQTPRRERLGRNSDCQAPTLLQRSVAVWPAGNLVARPADLVPAHLAGLAGHRLFREPTSGPIRPFIPSPEPADCDIYTKAAATPMISLWAGLISRNQAPQMEPDSTPTTWKRRGVMAAGPALARLLTLGRRGMQPSRTQGIR